MNINSSDKVCYFRPSRESTGLVWHFVDHYCPEKYANNWKKENARIRALVTLKLREQRNEILRVAPYFDALKGRSIQPTVYPLCAFNIFVLFTYDVLKMREDYSKAGGFDRCVPELLSAFASYRYHSEDPEVKNRFTKSVQSICGKLAKLFPHTDKIRCDFENWSQILTAQTGTLDIPLFEFDAIRRGNKNNCYFMSQEKCLSLIRRVTSLIEEELPVVEASILSLLEHYSRDAIAVDTSTNYIKFAVPEDCSIEKLEIEIQPDTESLTVWIEISDEDGLSIKHNSKHPIDMVKGYNPTTLKPIISLYKFIPPPDKLREKLSKFCKSLRTEVRALQQTDDKKMILNIATRIKGEVERVISAGLTYETQNIDRNKIAFLKIHKEYTENLTEQLEILKTEWTNLRNPKSRNQAAYQKQKTFLEERIKAIHIVTSASELLDLVNMLVLDLSRLAQAFQNLVQPPKVKAVATTQMSRSQTKEEAEQAMHELITGENRAKSNTKRAARKRRRRRKVKKNIPSKNRQQPTTASNAEKAVSKLIQTMKNSTIQVVVRASLKATVFRIGSKGDSASKLHMQLGHLYAGALIELLANKPKNVVYSAPTSFRLALRVIYAYVEQTLKTATDAKMNIELKTHNLWTYQHILKSPAKPVVAALHKGGHWAKYGREWNSKWKSWTTLPYRPQVLKWMEEREKGPSRAEIKTQIKKWKQQADSIRSYYFKNESCEVKEVSFAPLEGVVTKHLNQLQQEVHRISEKSIWMQQWDDDLSDLKDVIALLSAGITSLQLPLLVGYIFMLTTGILQSPLYSLQMKQKGKHSFHHNLEKLWLESGLTLSESDAEWFQKSLEGISIIHRYPLRRGCVRSRAHRLYLNAIALGLRPDLKGFTTVVSGLKEGELDANGTPYLNKYLDAQTLRLKIINLVEEVAAFIKRSPLSEIYN